VEKNTTKKLKSFHKHTHTGIGGTSVYVLQGYDAKTSGDEDEGCIYTSFSTCPYVGGFCAANRPYICVCIFSKNGKNVERNLWGILGLGESRKSIFAFGCPIALKSIYHFVLICGMHTLHFPPLLRSLFASPLPYTPFLAAACKPPRFLLLFLLGPFCTVYKLIDSIFDLIRIRFWFGLALPF